MKRICLLCNAHIDPVWLWKRNEGIAEALSTFRIAAEFCEKYDTFIFNHNESLLYEWVEEFDPDLFLKIKELVKKGKWRIMGGWYLQPDCVMPSGESIIRQIRVGIDYFKEHFNVSPTTAINFDPFGHSRGLVQILRKTGYNAYLFMRPTTMEAGNFRWIGFDGSEIIAHKIQGGYNSLMGQAINKIKEFCEKNELKENNLILWGIGNHGGGPSEKDLNDINEYIKNNDNLEIKHSFCEEYFNNVDDASLKAVDSSLVHCMIGCYTSMVEMKQAHRRCESKLSLCEKMLCQSGIAYNKDELLSAEKAFLFSEFHDILPGSCIKKAEQEGLRILNYSEEILDRNIIKAFISLCNGQARANENEIPILVYNPHPYEVEKDFETEFQLADQNYTENETTVVTVKDENGCALPSQNEKEDSSINLDWRKKVAFRAKLKPMSINRFHCELCPTKDYVKIQDLDHDDTHFIINTDKIYVLINKSTGLIDKYCVNGINYLKPNSSQINVYNDNEDPWGMKVDGFYDKKGEFKLLNSPQANIFNGYEDELLDNVRIIENGSVRVKIQAIFKYSNSFAIITYTIPKQDTYIDIKIKLLSNDSNKMFKITFNTELQNSKFIGQTIFGNEVMLKDNKEVVFQKWCGLHDGKRNFNIINNCSYGGSADKGVLNISLLRTPVYSAHPLEGRQIVPTDRNLDHIDMGEREFHYRILADTEVIDYEAEIFNQPPYLLPIFPSGKGEKNNFLFGIDNKKIILSALRESDNKIMLRLYNSSDCSDNATITFNNTEVQCKFGKYEVKTFIMNGKSIVETNMLGDN